MVGDIADNGEWPTVERAFGLVLRALRTEKRLSQEALAERSGLHDTHISRLERGRQGPTLVAVFALARALDVPVTDLIGQVEGMVPRLAMRRGGHSESA